MTLESAQEQNEVLRAQSQTFPTVSGVRTPVKVGQPFAQLNTNPSLSNMDRVLDGGSIFYQDRGQALDPDF